MKTNHFYHRNLFRQLIALTLVALLAFGLATPALAFDSREGNTVVIGADEVIEDDLYLFANYISIDGTVKGDVVAFGNSVTVNGVIEGDLIAAGRDVTVNGEVTDDLRFAAYALKLGPHAKIGDDVIAGCFSLETSQGSSVGGALVLGSYQGLLNGQVNEKANLGVNSLELNGVINGDVQLAIDGDGDDGYSPSYMPMGNDMPVVPSVKPGLNFGPEAKINGKLDYISPMQYSIPAGVVSGAVTHSEPPISPEDVSRYHPMSETNPVLYRILEALRFLAALIVIGLLVALLAPAWLRKPAETIEKRPLSSLGWGLLTFIAVFFALVMLITLVVALAVLFSALTLGNLAGLSVILGGSALCALLVAFGLVTGYLSYLVVGYLGGRWILQRINPAMTEKPYWALLVGIVILVVLTAIPILGGLVKVAIVLFGLGAIAILLWERFRPTPASVAPVVVPAE